MRLHVEALFTHDAHGDLVRVNEPRGADAPRFFLGTTREGALWRFRHDVDLELRAALEAQIEQDLGRAGVVESPPDSSPYEAILARRAPVQRTESGPAFSFPIDLPAANATTRITGENAGLLERHLAPWLPDVPVCQPMIAAVVDGHAVAVCASVRLTKMAHEAGVDTAPAYRRRGYALATVPAWAGAVREAGRVPLYSTSWRNEASRAVARKLALIHLGSDVHVT